MQKTVHSSSTVFFLSNFVSIDFATKDCIHCHVWNWPISHSNHVFNMQKKIKCVSVNINQVYRLDLVRFIIIQVWLTWRVAYSMNFRLTILYWGAQQVVYGKFRKINNCQIIDNKRNKTLNRKFNNTTSS